MILFMLQMGSDL